MLDVLRRIVQEVGGAGDLEQALTIEQIRLLRRYTKNIIMLFDCITRNLTTIAFTINTIGGIRYIRITP